jgi:ABC-type sugar transport system ATPase subunit
MNVLEFETTPASRLGGAPVKAGDDASVPKAAALVGFRPEDVRFGIAGSNGLSFRARVRALQPLGSTMIVDLATIGGDRPITAVTEWRDDIVSENDEVDVTLDARDLHCFDKMSLERVVER